MVDHTGFVECVSANDGCPLRPHSETWSSKATVTVVLNRSLACLTRAPATCRRAWGSRAAQHRFATQRLALWLGLAFGLIVAGVGVHALQALVDQEVLVMLTGFEHCAFRWIDVRLTGGLIAGTSDGIHKLAEADTSSMETTTRQAKAQR
jgi:hypothetical protein